MVHEESFSYIIAVNINLICLYCQLYLTVYNRLILSVLIQIFIIQVFAATFEEFATFQFHLQLKFIYTQIEYFCCDTMFTRIKFRPKNKYIFLSLGTTRLPHLQPTHQYLCRPPRRVGVDILFYCCRRRRRRPRRRHTNF